MTESFLEDNYNLSGKYVHQFDAGVRNLKAQKAKKYVKEVLIITNKKRIFSHLILLLLK